MKKKTIITQKPRSSSGLGTVVSGSKGSESKKERQMRNYSPASPYGVGALNTNTSKSVSRTSSSLGTSVKVIKGGAQTKNKSPNKLQKPSSLSNQEQIDKQVEDNQDNNDIGIGNVEYDSIHSNEVEVQVRAQKKMKKALFQTRQNQLSRDESLIQNQK